MSTTERPEFIDNLAGNTLARALDIVLRGAEGGGPPGAARIATAFFSPAGFAHVAERLKPVPEVRLLLGADPAFAPPGARKAPEETQQGFARRRLNAGLRRMDGELRRERDSAPFTPAGAAALRALVAALRAGNMETRRYEKAFLHAKAWVIGEEAVVAGSSNLTGAGLARNLELNLGRYDRAVAERARRWFDALWDEAEPCDLAVVFEEALRPRPGGAAPFRPAQAVRILGLRFPPHGRENGG